MEVCGKFTSVYHVSIGGCYMPCQYSPPYLSLSRASSSTLLGLVKPASRAARMLHTAQAATEPCSSIDQKKKAYRQMRYQYENNACSHRPPSLGCRRLQFKPDYDIKRYRGRQLHKLSETCSVSAANTRIPRSYFVSGGGNLHRNMHRD